jgi:hypothetical protein
MTCRVADANDGKPHGVPNGDSHGNAESDADDGAATCGSRPGKLKFGTGRGGFCVTCFALSTGWGADGDDGEYAADDDDATNAADAAAENAGWARADGFHNAFGNANADGFAGNGYAGYGYAGYGYAGYGYAGRHANESTESSESSASRPAVARVIENRTQILHALKSVLTWTLLQTRTASQESAEYGPLTVLVITDYGALDFRPRAVSHTLVCQLPRGDKSFIYEYKRGL